ncbi:MAG: SbcC/MukB-like Walker B domain-containing protein [Firmicutes bacterium]|nr:SbcC/MukB-like Walker B domain-containing protein [Bacillota bacterium]MDD3298586.1 SbcC/MukB-like Walker B domain-containing protein [Bacillota bacterium]MDD4708096.1 SbcC/MukB-like Walker B domain-containing protein [Bacillota bacterium]
MKLLKKMLLINWHYFWQEFIEFENINFLTGKNAAGKSTVIDAMQLLLLGDTNGHFFNKAANEKSSRNLKGYLRGEIGDDGDIGFRYLRDGRFTSYIACEFHDHLKNKDFTLGVVFDCYEDGDFEYRFFVLDSAIPENRFIVNKVPMSYKELRSFVSRNYKRGRYDFPDTNRRYQDILKGKLGGLKNKYFSLFKKAVPFSPITDIETFITEYICDVRSPVDISLMQGNIRSYKRLEQDAELMEQRISALDDISAKYESYREEKQRQQVQTYIIERAKHQAALDTFLLLQNKAKENKETIERLTAEQAGIEKRIKGLKEEKEKLVADKASSDINRKMEELKKQKSEIEIQLQNLRKSLKETVGNMRKYGLVWREHIRAFKGLQPPAGGGGEHGLMPDVVKDWGALNRAAAQALEYAELLVDADRDRLRGMGTDGFSGVRECIDSLKNTASGVAHSHAGAKGRMQQRLAGVKEQVEGLERGIKPYDPKLMALKNEITVALRAKYGDTAEVHILADLLEIKDTRWNNAVEGYLHTQKFYLIVEPEHFVEALKVYDRLKFEKGFYDWGLVDTGKLAAKNPKSVTGSLAEEVVTDNSFARRFVDHVMGHLMKCDSVEDLREHDRSITDSCMLYQNFVARQLNPERWRYPYIGRKSIEEQIRARRREMLELERGISVCTKRLQTLEGLVAMEAVNSNEAQNVIQVLERVGAIPDLEDRHRQVVDELGALDLTWLVKLDKRIKELEQEIKGLEDEEKLFVKRIGSLENQTDTILTERIPAAHNQSDSLRKGIEEGFSQEWIEQQGEPRFLKELKARNSAEDVANAFYSQVARTRSQAQKKWGDLTNTRASYIRDYRMSYDINAEDNDPYQKELSQLREVRLPDYKKQIQDAREKAYEQFRDDFLAKLKSNIDTLNIQIEELNGALKEFSFGNDRYRFVTKPKPEYRRYYDMITDNMLLEGYNINSQVFRDKHKDAIDELFRHITDVASELNADARAQLEKNIKRFTDYRTYLSFDLEVTDEGGQHQRLSRTLHKKSGGETQTPFYISVLASFAQLYRIRQRGEAGNTMRLIVFDEAFSKMDSERIQESIRLLRRLGLQAILSAPTEKIGDIAPLVDRNLCVIRNGDASMVKAFDSKKLGEFD